MNEPPSSINPKTHYSTERKIGVNRNCLQRFSSDGKDLIYCTLCAKYPDVVRLHAYNQRLPRIATANGTTYRADVIENHLSSDYHIACENVERIKTLTKPDEVLTPINVAINKANLQQSNYIGKLMIQVFVDAKILTLAAWNWPARYVSNEASNAFKFDQYELRYEQNTIPENLSLQYINPIKHLDLMKCIVEADRNFLKSKILDCRALSLRIDGSVD